VSTVSEIWVRVNADIKGLQSGLTKAGAETKAFGSTVTKTSSTSSSALKSMGPAFIAVGAAAAFGIAKAVDATVQWAREVKGVQNITGQTAESASALTVVFHDFGLETSQVNVALGVMEKNIGNNASGFTKYGVTVRDSTGTMLPFDAILGNISDKFQTLPTQADKVAFAMNVFGRSGKLLIPILRQGAAGLEKLKEEAKLTGLVIGQDTVDAAIALGVEQRKLGEAFKGFAVQLGTYFLPVMDKVIGAFTWITEHATLAAPVIALAAGFAVLTGAAALLIKVGAGIVATWTKVIGFFTASVVVEDTAAVATTALAGTTGELIIAVEALTLALAGEIGATVVASEGLAGYGVTETGLIAPTEALAAAQKDLAVSTLAAGDAAVTAGASTAVSLGLFGRIIAFAKGAVTGLAAIAAGAYALGSVSTTPVINDTKKLADAVFFATVQFQALKKARAGDANALSFTAMGLQGIAAIKAMIVWDRALAVSVGADAKAFDYAARHGISYADAVAAIEANTRTAAPSQESFLKTIVEMVTAAPGLDTKLMDITGGVEAFSGALVSTQGALGELSARSGQDFSAIGDALSKALLDPATTVGDLPGIFAGALGQVREQMQAWHDQIVTNFGGAGAALDAFANKSNVSLGRATAALTHYTQDIRTFGANIATIQDRFGHKADDFIQWATDQGLAQQGLVAAVASGSDQMARAFITHYETAKNATNTLASDIQKALAPIFERVIGWLRSIALAAGGIPPVKVTADTSQATSALNALWSNVQAHGGHFTPGQIDFVVNVHEGRHQGGSIMHTGGMVKRMHSGGLKSDEVPIIAQRGEFMVRRSAVAKVGVPFLRRVNQMHEGGAVGYSALGRDTAGMDEDAIERGMRRALRAEREKLYLDSRRFTRDLDHAVISDGGW